MAVLRPEDFPSFFQTLYGYPPFPWQQRLASQLASTGVWPDLLDLPTGTGKTAALDIALFHLALQAKNPERSAPIRILYVVDRRTIVDQAYDRARHILAQLNSAESGVLAQVRTRLRELSGEGPALEIALLRGGIPRSDSWARNPAQPLIAVSTVDQVGSRLLFRGYGVSRSMRPVHAGLLGNDALYLLDEVHLSQPFCQTLLEIESLYRTWGKQVPRTPFQLVQMSATSGESRASTFRLDQEDRRNGTLARRLGASKPAELKESSSAKLASTVAAEALRMLKPQGVRVLVVVNRVQSARAIAQLLSSHENDFNVVLVTGRMRPIDRDALEQRLRPLVEGGRERDQSSQRLVVVATQCIEAGADFDFDGLVTECASLDALRQRFGRLNRFGEATSPTRAVVVASSDSLKKDPIYGEALKETWQWLKMQPGIDFGWSGLPTTSAPELASPRATAPVLLPSHLDAWVQTSPAPIPDPDIALWLHGPRSGPADCLVVWRADLTQELLSDESQDELVKSIVESVAPSTGEAMPVPYVAVRRWLAGLSEPRIADVEGASESDGDEAAPADRPARPYFLWRGDDSAVIRPPQQKLAPGDTVIIPASYGGMSQGNWDPGSEIPVQDLGDLASFRVRGRPCLRLNASVLRSLLGAEISPPNLPSEEDEDADDRQVVKEWLDQQSHWGPPFDEILTELKRQTLSLRVQRIDEGYAVVSGRRVSQLEGTGTGGDGNTTEDDQASFNGTGITLREHLQGVARRAADYASKLGCPPETVELLRQAGLVHDIGKSDFRFQSKLWGGNRYLADNAGEPLAKSTIRLLSKARRDLAASRSGYPPGCRHECQSLAMLLAASPIAVHDVDLLLHLVASHHGHCRPFAPFVEESSATRVAFEHFSAPANHALARLDSGVADRFWQMVSRYGYWGLAWFEAILRLADHRQSESEQGGKA